MKMFDPDRFPPCAVDISMDLHPSEIASHSASVNLLLISDRFIGKPTDVEKAFQSLFDIAEEIAAVHCSSFVLASEQSESPDIIASRPAMTTGMHDDDAFVPVMLARHCGKPVLLDADRNPPFRPICDLWNSGSILAIPLYLDEGKYAGSLIFGKESSRPFEPAHIKLLLALSRQADHIISRMDSSIRYPFFPLYDALTHLFNRQFFEYIVQREISRSRRSGKPLSLLILDIDGFRKYNRRYHSSSGDIALQETANILQSSVREVDVVARLEEDSFSVLLQDTDAAGSRDFSDRIIRNMGEHAFAGKEADRTERLSMSAGSATFPNDSFDMQDLFGKAYCALSVAKSRGGGRSCDFESAAEFAFEESSRQDFPVSKIYLAARSVLDVDKLIEILLFTSMQGLSFDRGSVVTRDSGGNYSLRVAIGFKNGEGRIISNTVVPPGRVTSWVAENRKPLVVKGKDDAPFLRERRRNGYRTDSFLSIPLIHEDRFLGLLNLTEKKDRGACTDEDLTLLLPIAGEISNILHEGMILAEKTRSYSLSFLQSLSTALELRFPFQKDHASRVRSLSIPLGRRLGLSEDALNSLGTAAMLHDIGIVGIPANILLKNRNLNERELEIARKHPLVASRLLEGVPGLDDVRKTVLEHQEYFNGSGYPFGLRGEEISLGGRILSLLEFFVSITSARPHRTGLPDEEAFQFIRNNMNKLFDRDVCLAFFDVIQHPPTLPDNATSGE